jgi:hypothetical protein
VILYFYCSLRRPFLVVSRRNFEVEDSEQREEAEVKEPQKRGRDPRNWFTSTIFSTTSSYGLGAWGWYYLTTTSTSFSTSTSTTSRFTCKTKIKEKHM